MTLKSREDSKIALVGMVFMTPFLREVNQNVSPYARPPLSPAHVAELVDAPVLGTGSF